ncbi:MAG: serine/threonine protein kinase, partial [Gammaproteobacteria bacterium]|nr:serine/threonine protein kinase [Gammaproteobacteria bacterium]
MDDFKRLSPDLILDAIDDLGYQTDARILELNSYENRVFQIGIESAEPVIAKFYRSNRWTTDMIIEEHQFAAALADNDLSVVPPINQAGQSLFEFKEYRFALFKKRGGRAPAVDNLDCLESLGRHIAMIHNVGGAADFQFRPNLSTQEFGHDARATLLDLNFLPDGLRPAYESVSTEVLRLVDLQFIEGTYKRLRLHGDCHMGNVLWREDTPHFVDFDDARGGPAIQDLWMLLSGDRQSQLGQLKAILKGYQDFR